MVCGCRKNKSEEILPESDYQAEILYDFSHHVVLATYNDVRLKSIDLDERVARFVLSPDSLLLDSCRQAWKSVRAAWECSEGFLFGPVSYLDIDPSIDTWPVNFTSLDSLLSSTRVFDQNHMHQLEFSLKGFHPQEYMLLGNNGQKQVTDFTSRQLDYVKALSDYLKTFSDQVYQTWNPDIQRNYLMEVTQPGKTESCMGRRFTANCSWTFRVEGWQSNLDTTNRRSIQ